MTKYKVSEQDRTTLLLMAGNMFGGLAYPSQSIEQRLESAKFAAEATYAVFLAVDDVIKKEDV